MTENATEEQLINVLHDFVKLHNQYNKNRIHTSTEKEILQRNKEFAEENPKIRYERSEKANYKTFCAHGTNGWALFSACAFANGQLLPGNEIKLTGMFANSGENGGKDGRNSNFISTVSLLEDYSSLSVPFRYAKQSLNTYTSFYEEFHYKKFDYERLKSKFLRKYSKRNSNSALCKKLKEIFSVSTMQEAYEKLSDMRVVVIGDGIGNSAKELTKNMPDCADFASFEILYEQVNIRAIIVDEKDKDFVQQLVRSIDPELAKTIAFFTTEDVKKFEKNRKKGDCWYANPFIVDFKNTFELPFEFFSHTMAIEVNRCFLYKKRKNVQPNESLIKFFNGMIRYDAPATEKKKRLHEQFEREDQLKPKTEEAPSPTVNIPKAQSEASTHNPTFSSGNIHAQNQNGFKQANMQFVSGTKSQQHEQSNTQTYPKKPESDSYHYYLGVGATVGFFTGLVAGLAIAYLAGTAALTSIFAAVVIFIAAAVAGVVLGTVAGAIAGYGVSKCFERPQVEAPQQQETQLS